MIQWIPECSRRQTRAFAVSIDVENEPTQVPTAQQVDRITIYFVAVHIKGNAGGILEVLTLKCPLGSSDLNARRTYSGGVSTAFIS